MKKWFWIYYNLDIGFFAPIPWNVRSHIDEDFEESDIPFIVDIIDFNLCDESFKKIIQKDLVALQEVK